MYINAARPDKNNINTSGKPEVTVPRNNLAKDLQSPRSIAEIQVKNSKTINKPIH